jgi:hypothetical protein
MAKLTITYPPSQADVDYNREEECLGTLETDTGETFVIRGSITSVIRFELYLYTDETFETPVAFYDDMVTKDLEIVWPRTRSRLTRPIFHNHRIPAADLREA